MAEVLPFKTTMQFTYGEPRELAPGVVRIVANNPSPFTFKGTNTYIVGTGRDVALIDPGPHDPMHLNAILAAGLPKPAPGPRKRSGKVRVIGVLRPELDVEKLARAFLMLA